MAELVEKFEVPIPIRALKTANVYLIRESGEFSLIDTGMNLESYRYISNGLNNRAPARIILTHLHIDHIGGAMGLKKEFGSEVIMGEEDWRRVQAIQEDPEGFLRWMTEFLSEEGVPQTVLDKIVMGHSVLDHLKDYAELSVDRTIKTETERIGAMTILKNPGHSPGSISVMIEPGIMFTGDHVIDRITPNISFYDATYDSLGHYLSSLQRTMKLPATVGYPGHGPEVKSLASRCNEIFVHHMARMQEIYEIVTEPLTAYQVAARMRWSRGRTLDSMNYTEMNFAIGEAIAHLRHMSATGRLNSTSISGKRYYSRNPSATGFPE
ncbi:MAG TPA: MBL fold metallo-hydrolase [Thermoplasmataceae archaeon]|nr:MBL fold metallo-hydrolase [Thermoplasmataceae archaeon]